MRMSIRIKIFKVKMLFSGWGRRHQRAIPNLTLMTQKASVGMYKDSSLGRCVQSSLQWEEEAEILVRTFLSICYKT